MGDLLINLTDERENLFKSGIHENKRLLSGRSHNTVVFKLCAAALWGAVRNLKGAANFFRQDEILQFFYRNLLGCAGKNFWSLSGCREQKSLKTTAVLDINQTPVDSPDNLNKNSTSHWKLKKKTISIIKYIFIFSCIY